MDPITHTLTGAALGKAGLERRSALATPTLVLAANAPDVDVLVYLDGPYAALAFRRGLTHGLPAMAVLPCLVAGLVLVWDRWVRLRRHPDVEPARPVPLLALSAAGLLTHPVLDWMNTYGMRWLVPVRHGWTYGDALFIVDPWLWLLLGGALFTARPRGAGWTALWSAFWLAATALMLAGPAPAPARGVWIAGVLLALAAGVRRRGGDGGAGLGSGQDAAPGRDGTGDGMRTAVRAAGTAATAYVALMVAGDLAASGRVREAAARAGVGPVRSVMVAPRPADPLGGDVVVSTGDGYLRGSHRWLRRPPVRLDPGGARPARAGDAGVAADEVERAVEAVETDPRTRDFLRWSRFPRWQVETASGGYRVRISDLRYDDAGSLGGVEVRLDEDFRPISDRGRGGTE